MGYANTRHAHEFIDAHNDYKFSCQLLGVANTRGEPELKARALKCINAAKRRRKLAKDKLDRMRRVS